MLCKQPYQMSGGIFFPCGQCLPCRINRRRLWTHRIILEAVKHEESSFVTLTYSDDFYPSDGSLSPRELQLFLKKLRQDVRPFKFRYYAVGEYGDTSGRAHYHLVLFGLGTRFTDVISRCWGKGFVHAIPLTMELAQYICGYVTKKMTKSDDIRLGGRYPEFARMSNRPGIGAGALDELEEFFYTDVGSNLLVQSKDVPTTLMHGGRHLPLGRYLRRKLRERLQIPELSGEEKAHALVSSESSQELHALFLASQAYTKWQKLNIYHKVNRSKVRSVETKYKIFSSKGKKL